MTIKGPAGNQQAYIDAFNEVFGGVADRETSLHDTPRRPRERRGGRAAARCRRAGQYAGFLPALVLFGLFFLVPLGLIVAYSFWETIDYNVVHHWTLDNYRYFFSVPTYVKTLLGDALGVVRGDSPHASPWRSRSRTGSSGTCRGDCQGCCSCS